MFALQECLRSLGHDCFLIRYDHSLDKIKRKFLNYFKPSSWIRFFKRIKKEKTLLVEPEDYRDRFFDKFREKYIAYSPKVYSIDMLRISPPLADVYMTGSDQVWRNPIDAYFLNFGPKCVRRIAYAASFGLSLNDYNRHTLKLMKKLIKRIDQVSVREKDAIQICEALEYSNAKNVLDPTMLFSGDYYVNKFGLGQKKKEKYCLIYYLGVSELLPVDRIDEFAKKNGLEPIYIGAHGQAMGYSKVYPTIEEWVDLIKNAEFVVTNSFHGTVFSILLHTNFCSVPGKNSNNRFCSLLTQVNAGNHLYKEGTDLSKYFFDSLDFDVIDNKIGDLRAESMLFIKEALYV